MHVSVWGCDSTPPCHLAGIAYEPGVLVARLAMAHGLNPNLVFKWRRALRAGEVDPSDLLPVAVEAPERQREQPAPVAGAAWAGAIKISVGNTRMRIEGSPNEATLTLVLRMLRGTSGSTS